MDEIGVENLFVGTYSHNIYDKKELDVYLRVPRSSDQNTGLDITLAMASAFPKIISVEGHKQILKDSYKAFAQFS